MSKVDRIMVYLKRGERSSKQVAVMLGRTNPRGARTQTVLGTAGLLSYLRKQGRIRKVTAHIPGSNGSPATWKLER